MPRKVISKKRNTDLDMRTSVHVDIPEPVAESRTYTSTEADPLVAPQPRVRRRIRPSFYFLCFLTLGAVIVAGYFYTQLSALRQDGGAAREEKKQEMVMRVSRLIDLPKKETPALITITETKDLKEQPFFKNVEVGNIVLFYAIARKAYLYDPKKDIIVEVASLSGDSKVE